MFLRWCHRLWLVNAPSAGCDPFFVKESTHLSSARVTSVGLLSFQQLHHCAIITIFQTVRRPVMCVFNAVTGETLPIMGSKALLHTSVARLKTLVSLQSGFPVSAFRLSTSTGVQLYDCNQLQDYDIKIGMICFVSFTAIWLMYETQQ